MTLLAFAAEHRSAARRNKRAAARRLAANASGVTFIADAGG